MDYAKAVIEFIREGLWLFISWTCFVLVAFLMPEAWKTSLGIRAILNSEYGAWLILSGILTGCLAFGAIGRRAWYKAHEIIQENAPKRRVRAHLKTLNKLSTRTQLVVGWAVTNDNSKFPCSVEHSSIQELLDQDWGYMTPGGYEFSIDVWRSFELSRKQIRDAFNRYKDTDPKDYREIVAYLETRKWPRLY